MIHFLKLQELYNPGMIALLAFENLAQSAINGTQIVLGDRRLLESISDDPRLSDRARTFYRSMALELTQFGRLIESIDKLEINVADESVFYDGIGGVPVGVFSNSNYCDRTQLLVENLTDYTVIKFLAKTLLKEELPGFDVDLRAQNGGGSTIGQVLQHLLDNEFSQIVCVVDSDRKFEGAKIGDTARTAKKIHRRAKSKWRLKFSVLNARELENLVPPSLALQCSRTLEPRVHEAHRNFLGFPDSYSLYCCLKAGDSTCRMVGDVISKKRFELIGRLNALPRDGVAVVDRCGTCPFEQGCFASPALGQGFLQRVAATLSEGGIHIPVAEWAEELKTLVRTVAYAGLVMPPKRA